MLLCMTSYLTRSYLWVQTVCFGLSMIVLCGAGCYETFEDQACFQDGAAFDKPADQSDVCCDGSDTSAGNATCRAFYREDPDYGLGSVSELAVCLPAGVCTIPCETDFCTCVVGRDCRESGVCLAVDEESYPGACLHAGFSGDVARCTLCANCTADSDCPDGKACVIPNGEMGICSP